MEMLILERQLELVPEDVRARSLLAADYANLGRVEDAVRQLQMAAALRPNDANILYNVACTYGVSTKDEALDMLRRASRRLFQCRLAAPGSRPESSTMIPNS